LLEKGEKKREREATGVLGTAAKVLLVTLRDYTRCPFSGGGSAFSAPL